MSRLLNSRASLRKFLQAADRRAEATAMTRRQQPTLDTPMIGAVSTDNIEEMAERLEAYLGVMDRCVVDFHNRAMVVWRDNDLTGSAVFYAKDQATERVVDADSATELLSTLIRTSPSAGEAIKQLLADLDI